MKCPTCNYDDTSNKEYKVHGDFYSLQKNINLTRSSESLERIDDIVNLYGCPKCKAVFIV